MIVAELERALLARYPKTDAEPWDHVGLSVGDPARGDYRRCLRARCDRS